GPTYSPQPNVEACSTDTRACTSDGSTCSWYSGCLRQWYSKISHDGMLTTRDLIPCATSCSCAETHSDTSLPVASRITSGLPPPGASANTYAPRFPPSAEAYFVRSSVGTACRVRISAAGSCRSCRITFHASTTSFASHGRRVISPGIARRLTSC